MLLNEPPLGILLSAASAALAFFSGGALAVTIENLEANNQNQPSSSRWIGWETDLAAPARLLGYLSSVFGLFILSYQESPPEQESPPFTANLNASRRSSPPAQIRLALVVPLLDLLDPNLPLQALVFFGLLLNQFLVGVPNILRLVIGPRGVMLALGGIGVPLALPLAIDVELA